ncbi:hypothetical protein QO003_001759 [Arthrobacter silviterrae]|uniref:Sugar ABC transporter ATPase n=1 Tax=Arthrobacter silviterrae TaxID=2026658 RepID=A0ABX0DIT8_9MICC|nr:hypothetical protein [Arthrobacter silviterrae]MDQ0277456.1 hypothetical protein [Arthrobacter silviterrae]NGN85284.1 hypothetical protein [Arthrobacter silviterrae]
MGEDSEPLDPSDTVAVTEGIITPDNARPVEDPVNGFDTDTGLDSDRPVLLDDPHGSDTDPATEPDHDLHLQDAPDPSAQ